MPARQRFLNPSLPSSLLVHAILGIRPPAKREGRGSDSQDRMDQQGLYCRRVKEGLTTSIGAGRIDGSGDEDPCDRKPDRPSHKTVNRQAAWYNAMIPGPMARFHMKQMMRSYLSWKIRGAAAGVDQAFESLWVHSPPLT